MSHNIAFGTNFYGHRDGGWHLLGDTSQEGRTAVEVFTNMPNQYYLEKTPNYIKVGDKWVATGDFALVRAEVPSDPQMRVFGHVTDRYNILQPMEVAEMFDRAVGEPVETMGMLGKGERLFLTWKLNQFKVLDFDPVDSFAFLAVGYDAKYGANLFNVFRRVVCRNTWAMAVAEAERLDKKAGMGRVWRGKHNSPNMQRDLEIWMEHLQSQAERDTEFAQQQFNKLATTNVSKDEVYNLLFGIYPNPKPLPVNYPEKLRAEKQERIDVLTSYAERDRELVMALFGEGYGTGIEGKTLYDAFNAVTEYEDWGRMEKKDASVSKIMGNRANTKQRAMSLFYEYATVEG